VLAPVVADVPPGPQEGRPRSEITLALDQATRLPVPAVELLAADGGQHVRQVLGGDRPAPAVAGPVEQLVGLAEVPDLGGVVGPAQDLGEPVLGPSLPPQVPDRLERRQGLGEQAPRDLLVADVRLDAPKGEQRPGLEVLVARAPGPVPGRGGRRGRVLMPPELDEALGPPQRQADDEPGLLPGGRLGGLDGPATATRPAGPGR
jgi:hypothetical protein